MFRVAKALVNLPKIAPTTGTSNSLVIATALDSVVSDGTPVTIRAASANTSTSVTLTAGTITKSIVKGNNLALAIGDISGAGHWLQLQYDSVLDKWVLLNPANGIFTIPTGMIVDFSGNSAPAGYLACPLVATNVSRVTYAALFAALGVTWGAGDGTTTFGIPYFPADYVSVQASSNVGTSTVGQVIAHTHSLPNVFYASSPNAFTGSGGAGLTTNISGSTGGAANLAAGLRFLKCVKI